MKQNYLAIVAIIILTAILGVWILVTPEQHSGDGHGDHDDVHSEEVESGKHGGRLLKQGNFALELVIFERGLPPAFRVYSYADGEALNPNEIKLTIKLHRTGNKVDTINFQPQQDYLQGDAVIYEPHSFAVEIEANYREKRFQWRYESFEGRTNIPADMAQSMNIKSEAIGPIKLKEVLTLSGQVHINPNLVSRVLPRFAGVVKSIHTELGDTVKKGQLLATVQSNESLQNYKIRAPIGGLIVRRDVQVGEATSDKPLFIITDLSNVWVELDGFSADLDKLKIGQSVVVESLHGRLQHTGVINWISPLTAHASQSVRVRVEIENENNILRPGQYVRGHVIVAENTVKLAVRQSAIQSFRDFQVVYARYGDTYEVRMLELGRRNKNWVEVLSGIEAGTEYVTENSYLIKADIEKSGASHDH
ncbi:Probable Co/Zn/Cd efflux system membrane fusion protein [hydrothermal vent metagenome]|uniref:Probable Co/Zn/Cd efflux system membrane fusion protein n=1 Tax=hydrothermal vent metagenome TaxID=652676 RepID=A0A3B1ASG5_9ZZZZ